MIPEVIIGLDLGTHFGWAEIDRDGRRVASGHWDLPKGRARWLTAYERVHERIAAGLFYVTSPDSLVVCYEAITAGAMKDLPQWAGIYHGLRAIVEMATLEHGVRCRSIISATWKKIATGSGRATKPRYIEAANSRYGLSLGPKDEDEAAALGVAYACYLDFGGGPITAVGQQAGLDL